MPAVNYVTYGCFSSKAAPGVIAIEDLYNRGRSLLQLLLKIAW